MDLDIKAVTREVQKTSKSLSITGKQFQDRGFEDDYMIEKETIGAGTRGRGLAGNGESAKRYRKNMHYFDYEHKHNQVSLTKRTRNILMIFFFGRLIYRLQNTAMSRRTKFLRVKQQVVKKA